MWLARAHFFSGVGENTYGEERTRARDTVKLSWLGQHARLGEVGTKGPSKETPMRVPDQDKDVGRTHEPVLRKSPVIRGKVTRRKPARGMLHGKEGEEVTALSKRGWARRKARRDTLKFRDRETRGWWDSGRGWVCEQ